MKKARPYYEARCKYRVEKELALRASERFEHAVRHSFIQKQACISIYFRYHDMLLLVKW